MWRGNLKKFGMFAMIVWLLALVACGTAPTTSSITQPHTNAQSSTAAQQQGKPMQLGNTWQVTVNNVRAVENTHKPGFVFVVVDVTVQNISNHNLAIASSDNFLLRDDQGNLYPAIQNSPYANQKINGTYTPIYERPNHRQGSLVFMAPGKRVVHLIFSSRATPTELAVWDLAI